MNKEVRKIFIVLILYSLAGGFFYNFQELWMESNNLSVQTIGTVYSICALISVSTIFLCSNLIKQNKLKKFTMSLLIGKTLIILMLFFLNNTGLNILIKFLIMLDYVMDVEIYACIYPMITLIGKNNKHYALRGIIYEVSYYTAVILTVVLLGKTVGYLKISYNLYCLIAAVLLLIGFIVLMYTNLEKYYTKSKEVNSNDLNVMTKMVKKISKDKIIKNYLMYSFTNNISYNILLGLLLIIFTKHLDFAVTNAANLKMILGLSSSILGFVVLYKFTFKNDYINLSIKFVTRFILYILAFITGSKLVFVIALIFTRSSSESYNHITSAPYINRVDSKYQLAFCNLSEMVSYLAKSIGTLICGLVLAINIRYNFLLAAIFTGIGIWYSFRALYLRKKEV